MSSTPTILQKITARTRTDLDARRAHRPELEGLEASTRSLEAALRRPRTGFICECKKASPSRGLIREGFDPAAIARDYAWGADAISVLTDGPFFMGEHRFLSEVSAAVSLPVLCKDFVIDPYQVREARAWGADAILLMLSVLDDDGWRRCYEVFRELGMDALTEVHSEAELARATALGAPIIGINNRDLHTLTVDLATTERLTASAPEDRVLISESGIASHHDVRRLRGRVDAFLVGSALMQRPRVDIAVRELISGRVKVCGLTSPEDAAAAWRAGAVWGGMIFAEESPRCVDMQRAREVSAGAPLRWVGVFVNAPVDVVADHARALRLSAVQLHGEEDSEYIQSLRLLLPEGCEVWKAWRVRDEIPLRGAFGCDRLLLDTFRASQRGGTGARFDWRLLEAHPEREHFILSGGITPDNAAQADALGAWALDVNSGVERAPGKKSAEKLSRLFAELR